MTGARLPAVRVPNLIPSEDGDQETSGQEAIAVGFPSSSKFAIAWPTELSTSVPLTLAAERPVALSSSDGETDVSEEELSSPPKKLPRAEDSDMDFITPTNYLNLDQNPMDQVGQLPTLPRLSRAYSMPLPSQLGSLQNPRRAVLSSDSQTPAALQLSPDLGRFHELSLELADSVQMVIQTLLQLSPPQVLDPAKEQFSACALSIPMPSISALFTSMKNLNYMSANMSALSTDLQTPYTFEASKLPSVSQALNDFDVGELLQSVGDALSGVAAQAGVDLVLFHGDVGMRHIDVNGDESGISYTLSHVIRQVIGSSSRGDTVEIGLFVEPVHSQQSADGLQEASGASSRLEAGDNLRCTFHVAHRFSTVNCVNPSDMVTSRPQPSFNTLILRRLLRHVGASLEADMKPKETFVGRLCEVTVVLDPAESSATNTTAPVAADDATFAGYPEFRIASEPSLEQLHHFAESLRGKKATLHASPKGSFAHHLSSYLTAWGMDVSHVSTEPDSEDVDDRTNAGSDTLGTGSGPDGLTSTTIPEQAPPSTPSAGARASIDPLSFVLIDDDVAALRAHLKKIKTEQAYPLNLPTRKRPSLASNHRPRSSPQVARVIGLPQSNGPPHSQVAIVHFTSLSNFKLMKDAIQSSLTSSNGPSIRIPEIIVIPKPAGPRRFLTALHTAVTKPMVDPFFSPIATSPISPGIHSISPFFSMPSAQRSPSGRSTVSVRTSSDRSTRSPKEGTDTSNHGPPSPLGASDGMEYFSDAAAKLGTSPSTGLVIQSPDGQPAGIFFQPKPKSSVNIHASPNMERDKPFEGVGGRNRGASFLLPPGGDDNASPTGNMPLVPSLANSSRPFRSPVTAVEWCNPPLMPNLKGKGRQLVPSVSDELRSSNSEQTASSIGSPDQPAPGPSARRQSIQSNSPPPSPQSHVSGSGGVRRATRRLNPESHPSAAPQAKKTKGPGESNIVPPISVLIVEDNPINQTILSTFMKKRKIKYDVAKNGEEAVEKWRSGVFHLILMDIQMPVMDGIQATKEIRRIEKQNGAGGFPSTPLSEGQRTPSDVSTSDSRSIVTPLYRSSVIIVALTASSLQADRVAALAAGCNDFLTKPVSLQWLNSKIIEWGSIKALQMWADIRPEVVKNFSTGQATQAQDIARRLHVPEGRSTPTASRSQSPSLAHKTRAVEPPMVVRGLAAAERVANTPSTPLLDDSPSPSKFSGGTSVSSPGHTSGTFSVESSAMQDASNKTGSNFGGAQQIIDNSETAPDVIARHADSSLSGPAKPHLPSEIASSADVSISRSTVPQTSDVPAVPSDGQPPPEPQ